MARVKFTVRHAGKYQVSVVVDAQHVPGSPFMRTFIAGPADAQRSLVLRHCSTVVCTASVSHVMYVEPRDEYCNVCSYEPGEDPTKVHLIFRFILLLTILLLLQGFTVVISQLGTPVAETSDENTVEGYSITLDYDWQTQKLSVQLKFIYEGCYHATIKYLGVELHNGDFDIIVLNSAYSSIYFIQDVSFCFDICRR